MLLGNRKTAYLFKGENIGELVPAAVRLRQEIRLLSYLDKYL